MVSGKQYGIFSEKISMLSVSFDNNEISAKFY